MNMIGRRASACLLIGFANSIAWNTTPAVTCAQEPASRTAAEQVEATNYLKLLEAEWRSRVASSVKVKNAGLGDKFGLEVQELEIILAKPLEDKANRKRLTESLTHTDSDFSEIVMIALVDMLTMDGDRAGLVDLLSKRCPRRIFAGNDIEYWVVIQTPKIPDGFLILCDAFTASRTPQAKTDLAQAVRRSLMALGITATDDKKMVEMGRKWYLEHKTGYSPNLDYDADIFDRRAIFVRNTDRKK